MLRRFACLALVALAALLGAAPARAAIEQRTVDALASDDSDERIAAIRELGASGDARAEELLNALDDDGVAFVDAPGGGKRVVLVRDGQAVDPVDGAALGVAPANAEPVVVNNRLRGEISAALAALRLASADRATRLAAAKALQGTDNEDLLPAIEAAREKETDAEVRAALTIGAASLALRAGDAEARVAAAKALAASDDPQVRMLLSQLVARERDGSHAERDERVRHAAQASLDEIDRRLRVVEAGVALFTGLSLGSILLLAALGLAITYGLMGIINMAHGEFLMIGAYATWLTQGVFRAAFPGAFDWYVVAALPIAFGVCMLIGMALERAVLRHLYGRPLETLLTTWGISLLLIQSCRTLFGAQNVEVENPAWMAGGIALAGGFVVPFNRIAILVFALAVVGLVWLLLTRTRLGLFVRGVTQNRAMAGCCGVPTRRVDMLTFGLGSGIAGLGGVALSQIGNVGPDLGQSYIVDSFMVVVLGGVGQLAGTVIAAFGLGAIAKFLEPWSGAVLAKIAVLIFIVLFIQKRPQGLFALKGRSAEA